MTTRDLNHAAYLRGDALWKQGRIKEASQLFLEAVAEWPEDYQAFWALGNCYSELKKPRKAEQSFRQAIALCSNADKHNLVFNLANALFDQNKYTEAMALYSEIPSGHPLSQKAKKNVLLAESRNNNPNPALKQDAPSARPLATR